MKRLISLLTLVVFVLSVAVVFAQAPATGPEKTTPEKLGPSINCCVKGECKKVGTEADCAKGGGKVVKDCKDCK